MPSLRGMQVGIPTIDQNSFDNFLMALTPLVWLPMRATTGTIARNAAYTVYTPESPGPELLSNPGQINGVGSLFAFSGDNPTGWTVLLESGSNPQITEVAAGEANADAPTPGGGHVNMFTTSSNLGMLQAVLTIGDTYRDTVDVDNIVSGSIRRSGAGLADLAPLTQIDVPGVTTFDHIAATNSAGIKRGNTPTDVTVNGQSVRKIGELDALIAGTTSLGQAGIRAANEACLFDGATSILTITNRASIQGMTEFTLWMLFRPTSAGEGNAGVLFSKSGEFELRFNSASRDLIATVNYSTTNAVRVTNETLSVNDWHTVGMRINNTDKLPEIFIDGVQATYASSTAGEGTRVSNTNNLIIGNNVGTTGTLAGLLDEVLLADVALTDGDLAYLHMLSV